LDALAPLFTSFGLIFLAELGDKTFFAVLMLASKNRAWPVLLGSWAAFLFQSVIAVVLGSLFALAPPWAVKWGTAGVFLVFGLSMLVKKEEEDDDEALPEDDGAAARRVFLSTLGLVFMAEWGDATQIGSATLVAELHQPVMVFLGAMLGLWASTTVAVIIGRTLGRKVPARWMRIAAGILFCAFAVYTMVER
jgi:putative Ca2+/H+ antiporter (TMEM165/GDT1 family)